MSSNTISSEKQKLLWEEDTKPWETTSNSSEAAYEDGSKSSKEEDGDENKQEEGLLPLVRVDDGHRHVEEQE